MQPGAWSRTTVTRRGLVAAPLGWLLTSCQQEPKPRGVDDGTLERYPMRGEVIRVDEQSRLVTIKHGPITGSNGKTWMEAMTMQFPVPRPDDLRKLASGQSITATVVTRTSDVEYWIEDVRTGK